MALFSAASSVPNPTIEVLITCSRCNQQKHFTPKFYFKVYDQLQFATQLNNTEQVSFTSVFNRKERTLS